MSAARTDLPAPSLVLRAAQIGWKAVIWVLGHPWILARSAWIAVSLVLAAAFGLLLSLQLGPLWARFLPLALLITAAAALIGWHSLLRPRDRSVLFFLTRMRGATNEDEAAGVQHLRAFHRRLQESPVLAAAVDVRAIPVPVSEAQAERIARQARAEAVFSGEVMAISGTARWEGHLTLQWATGGAGVVHIERSGHVEYHDRLRDVPPRHEVLPPDADYPLPRLVAEYFSADHADRVEAALLAMSAVEAVGREDLRAARKALQEVEKLRTCLSTYSRAELEVARAQIERAEGRNARSILLDAKSAGDNDADEEYLWSFIVAMGTVSEALEDNERLECAQRAVAAGPESATARYNLGEVLAQLDRADDALEHLNVAAEDPEYANRQYIHMKRGVLNYNLGHFAAARDAYAHALRLRETPQSLVYLADAHRQLGDGDAAKRAYRRALRLDPQLVDAHRGYWGVVVDRGETEEPSAVFEWVLRKTVEARPIRPPLNRWLRPVARSLLRLRARRHPEDSRVHYMLGANALLRGQFEEARDRLLFAWELTNPFDTDALAVAAAAEALMGISASRAGGYVNSVSFHKLLLSTQLKPAPRLCSSR